MNDQRIYLDHAATTPCRPEAVEAMLPLLNGAADNPSSLHTEGRRARAVVDDARQRVAAVLRVHPREIVFTAGGSEANNLAIFGVARALRGRHLVTAATEHHSVLRAMEALHEEGWSLTVLPVDRAGRVDPDAFADALRDDTVLASIALANNEIGTVAPVGMLAAIARRRGVLFHTDAVQAPGWLPLGADELGVDLLSLSAHKCYGPKGAGVLYIRAGTRLVPAIVGGAQEGGRRAGTENVAAIAGLATALELAERERPETTERVGRLRAQLEDGIRCAVPDAVVHGEGAERLAKIVNVGFPRVESAALLVRLDLAGIAASSASACSSGAAQPSHVIAALGPPAQPRGAVRLSLGRTTTTAEIDEVIARVPTMVEGVRDFPELVGTS
ncbi:MAG: cysteine desulfurase [Candidatus Eremiobacteraeota bacterium]|nr:cysteine desulfurase [Candidatus Eremiobacteraeota bacterium]